MKGETIARNAQTMCLFQSPGINATSSGKLDSDQLNTSGSNALSSLDRKVVSKFENLIQLSQLKNDLNRRRNCAETEALA